MAANQPPGMAATHQNVATAGQSIMGSGYPNPLMDERSQFQHFCREEQKYHKAMADMYEWMLAQDLLGAGGETAGELMRTIFTAGLHALAKEHKG